MPDGSQDASDVADVATDVRTTCDGAADILLETGVISLTANLQTLPVWLHLFVDLAVDRTSGHFAAIATFARLEERDPALAPAYDHPDGLEADISSTGWAVSFTGCIGNCSNGRCSISSDPFDAEFVVLNSIPVTLADFQIRGTIYDRRATNDPVAMPSGSDPERDFASGTLTTTGGAFGDPPATIDPISSEWRGFGIKGREIPEGLPRVCEELPCASLDAAGGGCRVPASWTMQPACE